MRVTLLLALAFGVEVLAAEPQPQPQPLSTEWTMLLRPTRGSPQPRELPANAAIKPLPELQFTGPQPAHPLVLGNFVADGRWQLIGGGIQLRDGHNAALRIAEQAGAFELEGRIAMKDLGGWFMLVGWNDETGNGYAIHNCQMLESGSPWFITEMRGRKAVEGAHQQILHYEWKRTQDVRVSVREGKLTFELGRAKVLDGETLPNYQPGQIVFGVYDTKYGPRPVRIEALRIRALEEAAAPAAEANPLEVDGLLPSIE